MSIQKDRILARIDGINLTGQRLFDLPLETYSDDELKPFVKRLTDIEGLIDEVLMDIENIKTGHLPA